MAPSKGSFTALQVPLFDQKTGTVSYTWLKQFQVWQSLLSGGFDPSGNLVSNIQPSVRIVGRGGTIGSILEHISDVGVVEPDGMTAATATEQGAVFLPAGATDNHLGTAATRPSTAFDPAGAAAAAQTGAQTFATTAADTAESNAETFTTAAIATAFAPGLNATIVTAKLTVGGANGSMTFQNGILTAQVAAT